MAWYTRSMKLKKGDKVWVKLPMNATIVRVNQKSGYTLQTEDGDHWQYFCDEDVQPIRENVKKARRAS